MYCMNCGTQIGDGIRFCTQCGAPANAEMPGAFQQQAAMPQAPTSGSSMAQPMTDGPDLARIGNAYRWVITLFGIGILLGIAFAFVQDPNLSQSIGPTAAAALPIVLGLVLLANVICLIVFVYRLAVACGFSGIAYAIGTCIPTVGLFVVLILMNKANKIIKSAGYKVSFGGTVTRK